MSRKRRCIDFTTALVALMLFAPLMLMSAVAVCLESDGPAIFMQERMGRNGEAFTLYKFRSMLTGSHKGLPLTASGDDRITRVGALLRRLKIDELPQFLNVLKGDMSLVGPRPKIPHLEPLRMPFRPGITGPATLAFRFEEEMLKRIPPDQVEEFYDRHIKPTKAKLDWEYMQTASLRTDLGILWKTAQACFSKKAKTQAIFAVLPQHAEVKRKYPVAAGLQSSNTSNTYETARVPAAVHSNPAFSISEQVEF